MNTSLSGSKLEKLTSAQAVEQLRLLAVLSANCGNSLSLNHEIILSYVVDQENSSTSVQDLRKEFGLGAASFTNYGDRFEKNNYIKRSRVDGNRRLVLWSAKPSLIEEIGKVTDSLTTSGDNLLIRDLSDYVAINKTMMYVKHMPAKGGNMSDTGDSFLKEKNNAYALELENMVLGLPDVHILGYLMKHDNSTMVSIAKNCGMVPANATNRVDKLVKSDLVTRYFSTENRRNVLVEITEPGVNYIKKVGEITADALYNAQVSRLGK